MHYKRLPAIKAKSIYKGGLKLTIQIAILLMSATCLISVVCLVKHHRRIKRLEILTLNNRMKITGINEVRQSLEKQKEHKDAKAAYLNWMANTTVAERQEATERNMRALDRAWKL